MANASLRRRFGAILYDALLVLALMFLGTLPNATRPCRPSWPIRSGPFRRWPKGTR